MRNTKGQFTKGTKKTGGYSFEKGNSINKGRTPWNKGLKGAQSHSKETKIKLSKVHKGLNTWSKGRKQTEEHILHTRIAKIKYVEKTKFHGNPLYPTVGKVEKNILDYFENTFNYEIKRQYKVDGYFLDGYCPSLKLAIEIDEPFHQRRMEEDKMREQRIIKKLNCKFLRIQTRGEA